MRSVLKNYFHVPPTVYLVLLATSNEDPDSLFFSRKLSIEGNTEDGLYIKNLIDAMDFDIAYTYA